ncbi:hypothetical protein [Komagataeibacter sp. FNDCR2]|uniref:hypothetical protein n=1 Tax=Komagataeibacter sp. FNDCR2 TaxID=2878682 RepID=UPI001E52D1A2|nr:hypothetical protein [Komagataeibacter sp. FNDCR2]MCE2574846.1 hypothetical protein [Komagataeibacter sp. FNDCR2]
MSDDLDNISITPRGMGVLIAELGAADNEAAFCLRLQGHLLSMVRSYTQQGYSDKEIVGFVRQIADDATFRRDELRSIANIHHTPGHA